MANNSRNILDFFFSLNAHAVPEIGFKAVSYNVWEGNGTFEFDVEVKNNVPFAIPIVYALNDNGGEALSEFS